MTMDFSTNNVAIGMSVYNVYDYNQTQEYTNQFVRVKIQSFLDGHTSDVDAVYCEDLYAE